ncbi:hypothetical protein D1820_15475 [Phaeobacter sp. LSS9]|nr:hypothetical protein D1820_15475 [Phaeobacter sp. LSS9]
MSFRWRVHHLEQSDLRLTLLPGIGGRLWDVSFQGNSLLFQNPDLDGLALEGTQPSDLPTRSPQFGFPLWGGEKTWIAPDTSWANGAPFPALDSGSYHITSMSGSQIVMASSICPISQLSVSRRVTLTSHNSWTIEHNATNHGTRPRPTGIWSVIMLDAPSMIGVVTGKPEFNTVFGEPNGIVTSSKTSVIANCARLQEFKIGVPNPNGTSLIRCGEAGPWMSCSVSPPEQGDQFAHQYPFEIFNSGDYAYCEAEWHSPTRHLESGETMSFHQAFRVWANDEILRTPSTQSDYEELLSCMS